MAERGGDESRMEYHGGRNRDDERRSDRASTRADAGAARTKEGSLSPNQWPCSKTLNPRPGFSLRSLMYQRC